MASSNNLTTIEPWMFRSTTIDGDSWYPDAFARETESALTKALQQSFYNHRPQSESETVAAVNHPISSNFMMKGTDYCTTTTTASASTVTISGSGSEPETPGSKRRGGNHLGVSIGKSGKRKSRASKRSMTTFIQADPTNFRQMVQQVTGVKVEGYGQLSVSSVVKPEPLRQPFISKLQGLLPTLDTSAYLLDHQNSNSHRISAPATGFTQPPAMAGNGGTGMDFYSFSSFPTLESSI